MEENKKKISKVALYTRVSTDEQAKEGYSLEAQLNRLKAHCVTQEWDIQAIYIDDGFTGRNTRRPKYKEMMENIDYWDAILVLKMDRIHRNQKNFTEMIDQLKKKGKDFVSATESLDTSTAIGRFVMNIIQGIAQLESEQIGERVAFAMDTKAKNLQVEYMGGRTPFGYKLNSGKLKEIPEKLEIVKKCFDLYIQGSSFRSLGKQLGISDTTIRYYLNNIFYAGYERYKWYCRKLKTVNPLISRELWNITQIEMRSRCKTHHYEPIIIPENQPDLFKLDKKVRVIPVINRTKYNYS